MGVIAIVAQDSIWSNAPVIALISALGVALITTVVAPLVVSSAKARGDRRAEAAKQDERTFEFMKKQIENLQETVQKQGEQIDALNKRTQQSNRARDARIAQLEHAMTAGGLSVPAPTPEYLMVLRSEETDR